MSVSPERNRDQNATQTVEPTPSYVTAWGPRRAVQHARLDKETESSMFSTELYEALVWPSEHMHETAWVADAMCKGQKEDSTYGSAETTSTVDPAPDANFQSKSSADHEDWIDSESPLDVGQEDFGITNKKNEVEPTQAQDPPKSLRLSIPFEIGSHSDECFSLDLEWDDDGSVEQPMEWRISLRARQVKDGVREPSAAKLYAADNSETSGDWLSAEAL